MMKCILLALLLVFAFSFVETTDSFEDFEAVFEEEEEDIAPVVVEQINIATDSTTNNNKHVEYEDQADYDHWEEFEGLHEDLMKVVPPTHLEEEPENVKEEKKEEIAPKPKKKFDWRTKDWTLEITYAVIIAVYLLNMIYGGYRNGNIAKKWLKEYVDLYKANFFLVGHGKNLIVKESNSEYTLKTTGRVHCTGSLSEISLKSRHDLLSLALSFFSPSKDTLTVTIPLNEKDMQRLPFVFAILSNSVKSSFIKEHKDMQIVLKKSSSLPSNLECYTDVAELTSTLLPSEILQVIQENADLIEWIYVTDIHSEFVHSNILQVRYKIPSDVTKMKNLMKLTFLLIDFIPSITISKMALSSVEKVRKKLHMLAMKEANQQRQELAKAKKEEEKKEKLAKMTPEELEKHKKEQEKKRQRKLMSKQSKKMVAM